MVGQRSRWDCVQGGRLPMYLICKLHCAATLGFIRSEVRPHCRRWHCASACAASQTWLLWSICATRQGWRANTCYTARHGDALPSTLLMYGGRVCRAAIRWATRRRWWRTCTCARSRRWTSCARRCATSTPSSCRCAVQGVDTNAEAVEQGCRSRRLVTYKLPESLLQGAIQAKAAASAHPRSTGSEILCRCYVMTICGVYISSLHTVCVSCACALHL